MQIASSAIWTCMEFASASEYTATVRIFSSLHARIMRTAISPRLATRILSNMRGQGLRGPNLEKRLPKLDWLGVFYHHLRNHPFNFGLNLVHHFHRFDDAYDRVWIHLCADFDVIGCFGRGCPIKRPNHGRL